MLTIQSPQRIGILATAALSATMFSTQMLTANSATMPIVHFQQSTRDGFVRTVRAVTNVRVESRSPKEASFQHLAKQWKRETGHLSSVMQKARHWAYLRIIAMGPDAVPLLLSQLRSEGTMPHHWFVALAYVTGEDPVPEDDRGNVLKMRDAWLNWGVANGYGA